VLRGYVITAPGGEVLERPPSANATNDVAAYREPAL